MSCESTFPRCWHENHRNQITSQTDGAAIQLLPVNRYAFSLTDCVLTTLSTEIKRLRAWREVVFRLFVAHIADGVAAHIGEERD